MNDKAENSELRCDEDQLAMLRRCSEAKDMTQWREWRKENPTEVVQLQGANLSSANLSGADFSETYFSEAKLGETYSSRANLSSADLSNANLYSACLSGANLYSADLRGADLSSANLYRAYLYSTCLFNANLRRAVLASADLNMANLNCADLSEANLSRADLANATLEVANLRNADLSRANLSSAKLYKANLSRANLSSADLSNANLSGTDFRDCQLVQCTLTDAILTGVKLYGTARDDWKIDGVKCDYIYWDEEGENRTPKDRDFEEREFEELYKQLPTIEYFFENGFTPLEPLIMDRVVQSIRERNPDLDLKIDSINARGLSPSMKFTVPQEEQKETALAEITKEYEVDKAKLEGKIESLQEVVNMLINKPSKINNILAPNAQYLAIDGSTLNVQETSNYYTYELQKVIEEEPEGSESFAKVAKSTAMDIIGNALKDIAKGQVKEAGKLILELGKEMGPVLMQTAAYAFFKSLIT